eukprot:9123725-Alexandrium_andersonii.AAC.1
MLTRLVGMLCAMLVIATSLVIFSIPWNTCDSTTTYYDALRRTTMSYDVLRRTTTYYDILRRTT